MKKLVTEPLSKKIYWASVGKDNGIMTGERKDVTDSAIDNVTNHLILQDEYKDKKFFGYSYKTNNEDNVTICAFDHTIYQCVFKDDIVKLKEYKKKYELLCETR